MVSVAAKHVARDDSDISTLLRAAGCRELTPIGEAALAALDESLRQLKRDNEIGAAAVAAISKQLEVIRRERVNSGRPRAR